MALKVYYCSLSCTNIVMPCLSDGLENPALLGYLVRTRLISLWARAPLTSRLLPPSPPSGYSHYFQAKTYSLLSSLPLS